MKFQVNISFDFPVVISLDSPQKEEIEYIGREKEECSLQYLMMDVLSDYLGKKEKTTEDDSSKASILLNIDP